MWPSCGYNEIQEPRRKDVLIDYERLQKLLGAGSYDELRRSHKGWIEEYLGEDERARRREWTDSIAVEKCGLRREGEGAIGVSGQRKRGHRSW